MKMAKIVTIPRPAPRHGDQELCDALLRSMQVQQLAKFLVELQLSLPSEARYDATTMVLRKDDRFMEGLEWACARKVLELMHGDTFPELRTLPVGAQAKWLYIATEIVQFIFRHLEGIPSPEVVQSAMYERSCHETDRAAVLAKRAAEREAERAAAEMEQGGAA